MIRTASLIVLFALIALGGCRTPRGSLTWTGTDSLATEPAPQRGRTLLRPVERVDRQDPSSLPAGLTGVNKPNGPAMRYRAHVPPETPSFVPRQMDGLELFVADRVDEGWLTLYRGACGSLGDVCRYRSILYDEGGARRWDLDLNRFFAGDRYVEIQDIRYEDGALFFNEACATYAREAEGQCSWLLRVDPLRAEVVWRTPPLTSNDIFILHDDLIVAGYGFTGEPDALYLIDQYTGRIAARADLDTAHDYLEVQGDRLYVVTYAGVYTFEL